MSLQQARDEWIRKFLLASKEGEATVTYNFNKIKVTAEYDNALEGKLPHVLVIWF